MFLGLTRRSAQSGSELVRLGFAQSGALAEPIRLMGTAQRIAQLCENAGLMTRALEHYEEPAAIKRVITVSSFPY